MGSGANDTCFPMDFSPSSSEYCSPHPSNSSFFLCPSFPPSKRQKSCGWTDQLAAAAGNVYQPDFASFSPGACSPKTRRNKNTSQLSTKFPTKFLLLFSLPHFSGKNWPMALKLTGTESGKMAWTCKSCFLRKLTWNRKSWVLSIKEKMRQDPACLSFQTYSYNREPSKKDQWEK